MNEILPITAYIEGQELKPNGICCPSFLTKIDVKTDSGKNVIISVPIVKSGVDIKTYPITAVLKKKSASVMDCLYCVDACEDYTITTIGTSIKTTTLPPLQQGACGSSCMKQLHWYQASHTAMEGIKIVTQNNVFFKGTPQEKTITNQVSEPNMVTRALPSLIIEVPIPKMCGLISLTVGAELSNISASISLNGSGMIPADNHLAHTYDDLGGVWKPQFQFDITSNFIPGEAITAYGMFEGKNPCNPVPIAYGWFETKCFTSGIIAGCGLVDSSGEVKSGGPNYELNNSWLNDQRLQWFVNFKGGGYWLKCSDFSKYQLGQRCMIYKNGIGMLQNGGLVTANKCRNTDKLNQPPAADSEILTDSAVSYTLNINSDIIMPLGVYN
jgi:hypothetical protein